jgi:hypothetical protein
MASSLQLASTAWQYRINATHQPPRPDREQPVEAPHLVQRVVGSRGRVAEPGEAVAKQYPDCLTAFLSRVWIEMVLQALFMSVAGFVLFLGGLVLCVIGIYPAMMVAFLAQAHFHYQLYEIYLSRGGEPIPLMPPQAM